MWRYGLDRAGSGWGQVAGSCERGNEPFGFHIIGGISWLAKNRLASQEGLCSME